ncbi:MAG: hypothetical protein V1913_13040 [Fibrobacterota bacterium]
MKTFLLLTCLAALLTLPGCKKVENTTPRFNKDACLVCTPLGQEAVAGKCYNCKGNGTCTFCQGKGKRQVGKQGAYYEEVCAFCQGTGKCHYCDGIGKCTQCKGTGKYVPIAPTLPEGNAAPAPDTAKKEVQ